MFGGKLPRTRRFWIVGAALIVVLSVGAFWLLRPTREQPRSSAAFSDFLQDVQAGRVKHVTLRLAKPEEQGSATAALQLSDVLGTSLGAGLGGALVAAAARAGSAGWVGLAQTFAVATGVAVTGLLITRRLDGTGRGGSTGPAT